MPHRCLRSSWALLFVVLASFIHGWTVPTLCCSRDSFVSISLVPLLVSQLQLNEHTSSSITVPLRFLPKGGCLAIRVFLGSGNQEREDDFAYFAIVDTGSPFLTAPPAPRVWGLSSAARGGYSSTAITQEQYGAVVGDLEWRQVTRVSLVGFPELTRRSVVLGVVESPALVEETGGIFCGLIAQDNARPTVLQQWGFRSFRIQYQPYPSLKLSHQSLLPSSLSNNKSMPGLLQLVSLQSYGPDLYHYAVECDTISFLYSNHNTLQPYQTISISSSRLKRPILAVIDTGLTGCIISDSLSEELTELMGMEWNPANVMNENASSTSLVANFLVGMQVELPCIGKTNKLQLNTSREYFYCNAIQLPWFYEEASHPHIIALGNTFLLDALSITIDPISKLARIIL